MRGSVSLLWGSGLGGVATVQLKPVQVDCGSCDRFITRSLQFLAMSG